LDSTNHEKKIVNRIKVNPCKNVVSIYNISYEYYDAELLDTTSLEHLDQKPKDIACAIEQLHSIGIVYVDLKHDNMGYSQRDKVWKLFDFDCSGIFIEKVLNGRPSVFLWKHKPPMFYAYKMAIKTQFNLSTEVLNVTKDQDHFTDFRDIDWIGFSLLFCKQ
jgi:serine/threonine protein kinase